MSWRRQGREGKEEEKCIYIGERKVVGEGGKEGREGGERVGRKKKG